MSKPEGEPGPWASRLWAIAERVARNREYAGLHYPSDTQAGRLLAEKLRDPFIKAHTDFFNQARMREWGLPPRP